MVSAQIYKAVLYWDWPPDSNLGPWAAHLQVYSALSQFYKWKPRTGAVVRGSELETLWFAAGTDSEAPPFQSC